MRRFVPLAIAAALLGNAAALLPAPEAQATCTKTDCTGAMTLSATYGSGSCMPGGCATGWSCKYIIPRATIACNKSGATSNNCQFCLKSTWVWCATSVSVDHDIDNTMDPPVWSTFPSGPAPSSPMACDQWAAGATTIAWGSYERCVINTISPEECATVLRLYGCSCTDVDVDNDVADQTLRVTY